MTSNKNSISSRAKKIKRIILFIFFFLSILILTKLLRKPPSNTNIPATETSTQKSFEVSGVKLNDFREGIENPQDQDYITLSRTKDYHVFYIPYQSAFLISILSYPFEEYRLVAESDFLDKLGISREEACQLTAVETTPAFANPEYAGKEYGLSFCE